MTKLSELLKLEHIGGMIAMIFKENCFPNLQRCILIPQVKVIRSKKTESKSVEISFYVVSGQDSLHLGFRVPENEIEKGKINIVREIMLRILNQLNEAVGKEREND